MSGKLKALLDETVNDDDIAHDQCIRASVMSSGPNMVKIKLHPRDGRSGAMHARHPTVDTTDTTQKLTEVHQQGVRFVTDDELARAISLWAAAIERAAQPPSSQKPPQKRVLRSCRGSTNKGRRSDDSRSGHLVEVEAVMTVKSQIEWTDATWHPVTGCSPVSAGCANCWAAKLASGRLRNHPYYWNLAEGGKWVGAVRFNDEECGKPIRWRRGRRIFVCPHGDLFHPEVAIDHLGRIWETMAAAPQHIYQILTKRPERMKRWVEEWAKVDGSWPRPNIWLGISVENQETWANRYSYLYRTPAAIRWVSFEPLLGPVDPGPFWGRDYEMGPDGLPDIPPRPDWVVVGGESGPKARPCHPAWVEMLRDFSVGAGIPFFFKQWGEWAPGTFEEFKIALETKRLMMSSDGSAYPSSQAVMIRRGKKAAGNILDGMVWEEWPK